MNEENATLANVNHKTQQRMRVAAHKLRPGDYLYPHPNDPPHAMSPVQVASVAVSNGVVRVWSPRGSVLRLGSRSSVSISRSQGDA
ncbi:hypothetical protein ER308_07275 [Egibacter rhizosphaerae]|uniref:Uncharacterized protein n=1 Tax=Egibacter rhizosphaerae TaxID=1670831 RepID=A0A411YDV7_9ACTN|nr:hypothetical protein [Egibacter rhizosphaerae]QBI19366.1 hypothetical protein ER308_07275 [Egibacter rhizosphaerae]